MPISTPTKYAVTLTARQMGLVMAALETHSRIQSGQFDIAFGCALMHRDTGISREALRTTLEGLKCAMWPDLGPHTYRGVGDRDFPEIGAGYTIRQALRHRLAHDSLGPREKPGMTVDFDAPMQYGPDPVPTIERVT